MIDRARDFKDYAQKKISQVLDAGDLQRVYDQLCQDHETEKVLRPLKKKFLSEYLAARLALACMLWVISCEENEIEEEGLQKTFLKEAVTRFETPDFLASAVAFSEYLYAQDLESESSPVIAILQHLFKRLGFESIVRSGEGAAVISPLFQNMVGVCEAFKISFQNSFFEFITTGFGPHA